MKLQVSKQFVQDKRGMKMEKFAPGVFRRVQNLPALVKSFFRQQKDQYGAQTWLQFLEYQKRGNRSTSFR